MATKEVKEKPTLKPSVLWVMRILALVALGVSLYIAWETYGGGGHLAGCEQSGAGCEEVIHTRWSVWFGLPVGVAGVLVYAAIVFTVFTLSLKSVPSQWRRLIFLTVLAGVSGLWFVSLQLFVIKSFCVYCDTVHACGLTLAILALLNAPVEEKPQTPKEARRRGDILVVGDAFRSCLLGVAGLVVLAGGQLVENRTPAPVTPVTQVPPATALTGREVALAGGKYKMKLGEFPIFGSPNAQRIVVMIFDYTCPACRHLHPQLFESFKPHQDRSAIVMIPSPLDAQCNPGITETAYIHQNSCAFAKLGLAIWNTKPEAYASFDQFMFAGDFPPSLQDARSVADHLVGKEAMDAAMANPRYDQLVGFGVQLFYSPLLDRKVLPTLITPEGVIGGIPSPEQLPLLF